MTRALYDCPSVPLTEASSTVRLIVATHSATESAPAVGVERDGTVYELFVSTLPFPAFTASDVLDLAPPIAARLRPGWQTKTMSRTRIAGILIPAFRQEFAQILAQWMWNLRLELGQALSPSQPRTTEFAPARAVEPGKLCEPADPPECSTLSVQVPVAYGPPQWARPSFTHGFPGSAFTGASRWHTPLSCQSPSLSKGSACLRAMVHCGSCMPHVSAIVVPARCRAQCQESSSTLKPRRVSAVL